MNNSMALALVEYETLPRDVQTIAAVLIRVPPSVARWLGNDARGSQRRPTWTVRHLANYFKKSEEAAAVGHGQPFAAFLWLLGRFAARAAPGGGLLFQRSLAHAAKQRGEHAFQAQFHAAPPMRSGCWRNCQWLSRCAGSMRLWRCAKSTACAAASWDLPK